MPNISFELNLNKHPKDCKNRSLVYARNVQVSNDFTCLQTEHSITENSIIEDILEEEFGENEYYYRIISAIPCNKEIIFFVNYYTDVEQDTDVYPKNIILIRVNEDKLGNGYNGYICYKGLKWHGGSIKGDFTYNIKSQLIIAFSEYDTVDNELIPLKTINLGVYGLDGEDNEQIDKDCDINLTDDKLSLNPEIKIPKLVDFNYVTGRTYKGYYHIFIRYKINNHDYTKWYNVGYPIFIDEILKTKLFDYIIRKNPSSLTDDTALGFGITDYFSSVSDICNKTVNLVINHRGNNFSIFQIGIINVTKDTSRCFKTLDLNITNNNQDFNFKIDISSMEEYSINDIIFNRYNYYNVKGVENYQNRLYLSNYKEVNLKYDNLTLLTNSIKFKILHDDYIQLYGTDEHTEINDTYDIRINDSTSSIEHTTIDPSNYNIARLAAKAETLYGEEIYASDFLIYVYKNGSLFTTFTGDNNYNNIFENGSNLKIITNFSDTRRFVPEVEDVPAHWEGYATLSITAKLSVNYEYLDGVINNYLNRLKNTTLIPGNGYKFYIHYINKYGEQTEGFELTNLIEDAYITKVNGIVYIKNIDYNKNNNAINYPKYTISINNDDLKNVKLNNPNIVGFFLSYEKFIKNVKYVGVLTRFDFSNDEQNSAAGFINNNNNGNADPNTYKFYCSELDINDSVDLNINKLKLNVVDCYDLNQTIQTYSLLSGGNFYVEYKNNGNIQQQFVNDIQKSLIDEGTNPPYDIKLIDFIAGHNFSKDNGNFGSYLKIVTENSIPELSNDKKCAIVVLYNDNTNIYLNENKTLIKFSDIVYIDELASGNIYTSPNCSYNGRLCYNRYLIYDYNRVILSTSKNIIVNNSYYSYIKSAFYDDNKINRNTGANYVPVKYVESINYSDIVYEAKCFNFIPEIVLTDAEKLRSDQSQDTFALISNVIVQPMNSIDLFKDRFGSQDTTNPLTYINYKQDYIKEFNKRIIRSNPIADESFENSWRIFSLEQYKDISENKGNITNIIGVGTTLLVHTEHSLFMFDRNNTLKTGDKDIQLSLPDTFDVDYKEVFTSELGVCGLQDSDAYIVDEFGYIFYDNDAHRLYKFGQGKISFIDESIIQWLNKYKPSIVRFANDKETNRIIVDFWCYISSTIKKEFVISYNYAINKWISFHDYCFDYSYNTKNLLYYIMVYTYNERKYTKLYYINQLINNRENYFSLENQLYGKFHNRRDFIDGTDVEENKDSEINIIVNDAYEVIKTLEYLSWKLYRINNGSVLNSGVDRENYKIPYSGNTMRIFNDIIDTGQFNILVQENDEAEDPTVPKRNTFMNYKLPWWEYGNWNFNYLINIKNAVSIGDIYSRLIGNYFIIKITFTGVDSRRAEFETLDCKLIQNNSI